MRAPISPDADDVPDEAAAVLTESQFHLVSFANLRYGSKNRRHADAKSTAATQPAHLHAARPTLIARE